MTPRKPLLLCCVFFSGLGRARAQSAVAVLSADLGPYKAAFDSFEKALGQPIPSFNLAEKKPALSPQTRVVVAFGGKAVLQSYPKDAVVIACMAPGVTERAAARGAFSTVTMRPPPEALLANLRKVQPALKRLAVLWSSAGTADYLSELKLAAAAVGMEIIDARVKGSDGLPDVLRAQRGKADALWLTPDPALVTPEAFQTIKQFSWDNAIPFYAPTSGLAAAGAAAAVSVSAQESGREAAELVRQALDGKPLPERVYSSRIELTLNPQSAAKAGLVVTPQIEGQADKVIR